MKGKFLESSGPRGGGREGEIRALGVGEPLPLSPWTKKERAMRASYRRALSDLLTLSLL